MMDSVFENLLQLFNGNVLLAHAIVGIAVGLSVLIAGKIFKFLLNTVVRKIISRTDTQLDDQILDIIRERVIAFSGIIGLYLGIGELRLGLTAENTSFHTVLAYADGLLFITAVAVITSVVIKCLQVIVTNLFENLAKRNNFEEFGQTLPLLANRVLTFVMVAIAAIIVLDRFGQSIGSILTILGAGSLAIGLAAQDTISNMISGFIVMIDRPFRVGDRIRIPTGEVGDVIEIGLRSTKIMDFDNNVLIVPNNDLVKTRIVNYGYPHNEMRVVVEVTVAYGSDVDAVKKILVDTARSHPDVLSNPSPEAILMKLSDWSLNFSLICRVADYKIQFRTAEALRIAVYNNLLEAKIEIPYPQQVVHLKNSPTHALRTPRKRKKVSR